MNLSRISLLVLLASLSGSVVACSAPADDGDDSSSDESDIKKKVKPKGGNGEFDLIAPTAFKTDGFQGSFTFDSVGIKPGASVQKVPGTYQLVGSAVQTTDGTMPSQLLPQVIAAGAITKTQLGGLHVAFDRPVTLGSVRVDITANGSGYLDGNKPWATTAAGASMLFLPGNIMLTSSADASSAAVRYPFTIAENKLSELVLPTAKVTVAIDAYDPDYPTPASCTPPFVRAGSLYTSYYNYTASANVRKADGSSSGDYIVPAGSNAPVTLSAYGIDTVKSANAGATLAYTLNRLEVDDVEVAQAGGGSTFVKGIVTVVRKNSNGTTTALNCSFTTHSGIDLPDGDYTVKSSATTASGTVTSSEDVSFP